MNNSSFSFIPANSFDFSLEHVWDLIVYGFIPSGGWIFLVLFGWLFVSGLWGWLKRRLNR